MNLLESRQTSPLKPQLGELSGGAAPDLGVEDGLNRIARLAARLFDAPFAAIVVFDAKNDRAHGGPRGLFGSPDASWLRAPPPACARPEKPGFLGDGESDWPSALAFQAAAPLIGSDGQALGLLRVADVRRHAETSDDEREAFGDLAALAARLLMMEIDIGVRDADAEQRKTLVAELDHRVKNVLAAVQSLAAQSARRASSLDGFLKTFGGRLKSMASAHQLLTATRWKGAGLQNIAAAELGGLAPGQTRWQGPDLLLNPRAANAMSLALHELATNAVKFGALSVETGRVDVEWRALTDGGLTVSWIERSGPLVAPPTRHGFGRTLLEKVTGRELSGEVRLAFPSEGVRAVIIAGPNAMAEAVETAEAAPAAAERSPAPGPSGASAGSPLRSGRDHVRGLKVLIVEDALLLALELEAGLQEAGAEVVGVAGDLSEALGMTGLPIDVAVLDTNLNGVSVTPVAEALVKRGVPFVFATGYGDHKPGPPGFDAPVIRKPYDVTQVVAALAEVMGRL